MTQSLKRSEPLILIDLQYLLHKVNELVDLQLLLSGVLKHKRNKAKADVVTGFLSLLGHVLLVLLTAKLRDVVALKEIAEVPVAVIVERLVDLGPHLRWDHRHHEVIECFEFISLPWQVEAEESVTILALDDHFLTRTATKFKDFQKLIVVILSRKDRNLNEHLDGGAGKRPHINALVVARNRWIHFSVEVIVTWIVLAAHQHFRRSVIAGLDIGVDLMAMEGSTAKVN